MSTYPFPPDLAAEIQRRMETGQYSSEDDVLRDALNALQLRDEEVSAIQEGIDDMEAGCLKSFVEFDRDFRARKNFASES